MNIKGGNEYANLNDESDRLPLLLLAKANALVKTAKIYFKPNDIRYIIVKKDEEILKMIAILEKIKGDKYSSDIIKILTSRILTYEQIESDF